MTRERMLQESQKVHAAIGNLNRYYWSGRIEVLAEGITESRFERMRENGELMTSSVADGTGWGWEVNQPSANQRAGSTGLVT
jgi:hypothetical protein